MRHRWHTAAHALPFVVFPALLPLPLTPSTPQSQHCWPASLGMLPCRRDLWRSTLVGSLPFPALRDAFLLGLK